MRSALFCVFVIGALSETAEDEAPDLPPEASEIGEDIACRASEFGLSWLRVRGHLQALFSADVRQDGSSASVEAAAGSVLANLVADPRVPDAGLAPWPEVLHFLIIHDTCP